jgi:glycosyltransferase involved in cell wall biosynthesis
VFLAPQPFFEVRGTPLAVLSMVRALTERGHAVDLLSYPQGDSVELSGLRHLRSLRLPVGRVKAGPSLAKLLLDIPFMAQAGWRMLRGRYDVVHAVEEAAHLAAPLARLLRLPFVMDIDSSTPDQLRESGFARRGPLLWFAEVLEAHALRRAAAVITVCQSLTDSVRARVQGIPVFQVEDPPLVDTTSAPDASALASLRSELDLLPLPVLLYSGNFEPYQGVELLIDAAAGLPEAQLVLMGGEPREIEELRRRATASGAVERCRFAGKRPPSELPVFLALADLVVSPRCRGVNTPFKIYTYLASGKPLVATRIPTHTQLLDESTAFLVEPTAEGLASGIRQALSAPEEATARAARGRQLIEREYSKSRYGEKVARAYQAVEQIVAQRQR